MAISIIDKDGNEVLVAGLGGSGDMSAAVYDPQGKQTDVFAYADDHFVPLTVGMKFLGSNPINAVSDDTISKWLQIGRGYCAISSPIISNQPSQYGYLLNHRSASGSSNIVQLWLAISTGEIFRRGGNANGWTTTWQRIYDTANLLPATTSTPGLMDPADKAKLAEMWSWYQSQIGATQ